MDRNSRVKYEFGALTMGEAKRGAETCLTNSERLTQAAMVLYRKGFVEQATFLACTAIEEVGKAILLLDYQEASFCKDPAAARTLGQSFTQHVDKLESALFIWKWDETFFREIRKLPPQEDKSIEEVASAIRQFFANFRVQSPRAGAKRTFKRRNVMLYTDFQSAKFISPQRRANKKTFEELVKIAEKTIVRTRLDSAVSQFFYRRGSSREQFGKLFLENLPGILTDFKEEFMPTK